MGFLGLADNDSSMVSSETTGVGVYPLVVTGSPATNVWAPNNNLPPNNRGVLILSRTHPVSALGRKLTLHGGLPHVFNSRTGVMTPIQEALTLALFVDGVCVRAISLSLTSGSTNYYSFAQIAATVSASPATHTIEMKLMVPSVGSSFTVGGAYGSAGHPYLIVRESS